MYRQAFAAPLDYYTGINAASKSLLLGEHETAAQLAARVETLVGVNPVPGKYWPTATVAEVQLLRGNLKSAAALYLAAVLTAPEDLAPINTRTSSLAVDGTECAHRGLQGSARRIRHPGCNN